MNSCCVSGTFHSVACEGISSVVKYRSSCSIQLLMPSIWSYMSRQPISVALTCTPFDGYCAIVILCARVYMCIQRCAESVIIIKSITKSKGLITEAECKMTITVCVKYHCQPTAATMFVHEFMSLSRIKWNGFTSMNCQAGRHVYTCHYCMRVPTTRSQIMMQY